MNIIKKVAHFGTFDVENFGDLLFPLLAQKQLGDTVEITAVSPVGGPPVWQDSYRSLDPITYARLADSFDAVLIGGGNIVRIHPSSVGAYGKLAGAELAHYADIWLGPSLAAPDGCPIIWLAPGVPERIPTPLSGLVDAAISRAEIVSVRDEASRRNLLGIRSDLNIDVAIDPAWAIDTLWSPSELDVARDDIFSEIGISSTQRIIVFHLNRRYTNGLSNTAIAALLDKIAQSVSARPILLALGPCHGDGEYALPIGAAMTTNPITISNPRSLRTVTAILRAADLYVGSSMHGFITSSAFGIPAICVASKRVNKFAGLQQLLGQDDVVVERWDEAVNTVSSIDLPKRRTMAIAAHAAALRTLDTLWNRVRSTIITTATSKQNTVSREPVETFWMCRVAILSACYSGAMDELKELQRETRKQLKLQQATNQNPPHSIGRLVKRVKRGWINSR